MSKDFALKRKCKHLKRLRNIVFNKPCELHCAPITEYCLTKTVFLKRNVKLRLVAVKNFSLKR